jgi:LPXTG-motif cell wall-anchored protein
MNVWNLLSRWFALGAIGVLILFSAPPRAAAQDTTTTQTQPRNAETQTSVRNAEVVYVEGSDLVLKLESGRVEHLVVPDSDVFTIDGKDVSVGDLKPGTRLTQTITTTTTPHYVNSVRTLKGKVWHVSSPNQVIIAMPDGNNQIYRIPSHAKFIVDGKERDSHQLRKGMNIEVTAVTDDTHTVVSQNKTTLGQAPAPPLPRLVGMLVFPRVTELLPEPAPVGTVTTEHAWATATLPQTGSSLPWLGVLGLIAVALYLGLRLARNVKTN